MERLPRRSQHISHRIPTRRSTRAQHGPRRRGDLPRSVRSRISTSSWPMNLSRPIAYLREDAAKSRGSWVGSSGASRPNAWMISRNWSLLRVIA